MIFLFLRYFQGVYILTNLLQQSAPLSMEQRERAREQPYCCSPEMKSRALLSLLFLLLPSVATAQSNPVVLAQPCGPGLQHPTARPTSCLSSRWGSCFPTLFTYPSPTACNRAGARPGPAALKMGPTGTARRARREHTLPWQVTAMEIICPLRAREHIAALSLTLSLPADSLYWLHWNCAAE